MKELRTFYQSALMPLLIACILTLSAGMPSQAQSILQRFDVEPLVLELADGSRYDIQAEIAKTYEQKAQGLMYRRKLDQYAGMLFIYDGEAERTMWMKNTLIPLDMLFIDQAGYVVSLSERAVTGSLATISSGVSAAAVLELNSGMVQKLGIQPGDRVIHEAFGPVP
jgi:hypothetical protein